MIDTDPAPDQVSTAHLVPVYPDDWRGLVSGRRWGRRLAAIGFALLSVPAYLGCFTALRDPDAPMEAWAALGVPTVLLVTGLVHWPWPPGRDAPQVIEVEGERALVFGRTLWPVVAVCVPMLLLGLALLKVLVGQERGDRESITAVAICGLILGAVAWYLFRRLRRPDLFGVVVSSRGVRASHGSWTPWEEITTVRPQATKALDSGRYPGFTVPGIVVVSETRLEIEGHNLRTHPAVLLNLMIWCVSHRPLRTQLTDPETLALLDQIADWARTLDRNPPPLFKAD